MRHRPNPRKKKDQPIMCQKRSLGNMYKNGSSLIGDYVGEHQQLTGLPFRPNATSYGSLQQGQRGLTLYPSRLGTAGMTLSEQINNTTLNILHGVRRSDPPPPPPLPSVLLCFAFVFCALTLGRHIAFCSHLMLCCGAPFACSCEVLSPRGLPFTLWQFFWCGFDLGCALLPSFVLGLVFLLPFVRGLSVFVVLSFRCFCLRVSWCLFVVVVLLLGVVGPLCVCFVCLAVVGSLPCRSLLPFPLRLVLCGALAQFIRWSLPLGIWLLS